MLMRDLNQEKKHLIILDFDGTLYHNPDYNFSIDIALRDIVDAYVFFNEFALQTGKLVLKNTEFILATGRSYTQQPFILRLLEEKGYRIDQAFFSQMSSDTSMDETTFMIEYWTAKARLINQLKLSNEFETITIIDDDGVICSMLEKLNFEVFKAEISRNRFNNALTISFNPPQKRLMTELQTTLKHRPYFEKKKVDVEIF
jgi:hydroxymethylpyrimidine pyrophosphatase-like HAD family hydrolase